MSNRPFEDDEDPTPRAVPRKPPVVPAKPAVPAKPQAAPAKPPSTSGKGQAAAPLEPTGKANMPNWGHAGNINFLDQLTDRTGRRAVVRLTGAGIRYVGPPLDRHIWQPALEQPGRYEMIWLEGDPAKLPTLGDFTNELRQGSPSAKALARLDQVADRLLVTTHTLHQHGWRLGLLHQGNILLFDSPEGLELVLPDLGFLWLGSHGKPPWTDSPGRPKWLEEDRGVNRIARLWDNEPVWQQFSWSPDEAELPIPEAAADLHTLARIFAAVLTGRTENSLTVPPNSPPCWEVLRAVMNGEVASAEEFRNRLAGRPLSTHWTAPRAAEPRKKSMVPIVMLLLLLLGGGGALAVLWQQGFFGKGEPQVASNKTNPSNRSTPQSTKPGPPKIETDWKNKPSDRPAEGSEFDKLLKQFDATADPKIWLDLLGKMYDLYEKSSESDKKAILQWMEHCRGRYVTDWGRRYRDTDATVVKDPSQRYDVAKSIHTLHDELGGLRQKHEPISPSLNERESACLEISALRSSELGLPHSP